MCVCLGTSCQTQSACCKLDRWRWGNLLAKDIWRYCQSYNPKTLPCCIFLCHVNHNLPNAAAHQSKTCWKLSHHSPPCSNEEDMVYWFAIWRRQIGLCRHKKNSFYSSCEDGLFIFALYRSLNFKVTCPALDKDPLQLTRALSATNEP